MIDLRTFFPARSFDAELRKAAVLRMFLGGVVFARFIVMFLSSTVSSATVTPSVPLIFRLTYLLVILCFTVGFLTPVSTMLVAIGAVAFDQHLSIQTSGTSLLCGVLLVFFIVNPGQRFSIDRVLATRGGRTGTILGPLQSFSGAISIRQIRLAYLIGFLFFALVSCVGAIHLLMGEDGLCRITSRKILTNPDLYACPEFFLEIGRRFPGLFSLFGIMAVLGQSVFQLFMIPLMWVRLGRCFVRGWGGAIFFMSCFLMPLSYLPYIGLILWILIFVPIGDGRPRLEIVYDDRCNLCQGVRRTLSVIDLSGALVFLPASRSSDSLDLWGVGRDEISTHMVGAVRGKVQRGYMLWVVIAKELILLWPLVPFLWLGYVLNVGPRVYRFVAARRRSVFGSCEGASATPIYGAEIPRFPTTQRFVARLCYVTFTGCCVLFILVEAVALSGLVKQTDYFSVVNFARKTLSYAGFVPLQNFPDCQVSFDGAKSEVSK